MTILTRRQALGAIAAVAAVAGCSAPAARSGAGGPSGTRPPDQGKLLVVRDGKFLTVDLATRQMAPFVQFPADAFGSAPALSPDRRRIAYAYFVVPKNRNDLGGNDLYVMDAAGTNPRLVQTHARAGGSFEDPAWAADGKAIFATLRAPLVVGGQTAGETTTIVRVPSEGGDPLPVTAGDSPSASPDGKYLAYLSTDKQSGRHLWVASADGRDVRELAAGKGFTNFRAPRFSPNGEQLIFAGENGPAAKSASSPSLASRALAFLGPGIAEADGIPMQIWAIRPDGSSLRQLTHSEDHSPTPAWSPDGQWVAVAGELKLQLVDVSGQRQIQLAANARLSGITWLA